MNSSRQRPLDVWDIVIFILFVLLVTYVGVWIGGRNEAHKHQGWVKALCEETDPVGTCHERVEAAQKAME